MNVQRLVGMANDIAAFFAAEPDRPAGLEGMRTHLNKFWEPRMRAQIVAHLHAGGGGLDAFAREAIAGLAAPKTDISTTARSP